MPSPARVWLALLSPILCGCADSSDAVPSGHAGSYESSSPRPTAETSPPSHRPSENAVPVYVDPAVELVCTIYRLAGLGQYTVNHLPPHIDDLEERFGPWRTHRVVTLARELWRDHGITGSAPVALAVYLTPPPELKGRVPLSPLPGDLDPRWTSETASAFLDAARDFATESRFMEYFSSREAYFQRSVTNLAETLNGYEIIPWLQEFYGQRADAYAILVGMQAGRGNYGLTRTLGDGSQEFISVIGANSPSWLRGVPRFRESWVIPTVVHEWAHSFANPFVFGNEEVLRPIAERLYPSHQEKLVPQGYSTWQHLCFEYLVRATVVRYLQGKGDGRGVDRRFEADQEQGFPGIRLLSAALEGYETNRDLYPTLTEFLPRLVECFEEIHQELETR